MSDIFTNEDEVNQNITDSVEKLGIAPKQQTKEQKGPVYIVKKNCKFCWGKGLLRLITPKGQEKNHLCRCVRVRYASRTT